VAFGKLAYILEETALRATQILKHGAIAENTNIEKPIMALKLLAAKGYLRRKNARNQERTPNLRALRKNLPCLRIRRCNSLRRFCCAPKFDAR